jgi:hypothetical protein
MEEAFIAEAPAPHQASGVVDMVGIAGMAETMVGFNIEIAGVTQTAMAGMKTSPAAFLDMAHTAVSMDLTPTVDFMDVEILKVALTEGSMAASVDMTDMTSLETLEVDSRDLTHITDSAALEAMGVVLVVDLLTGMALASTAVVSLGLIPTVVLLHTTPMVDMVDSTLEAVEGPLAGHTHMDDLSREMDGEDMAGSTGRCMSTTYRPMRVVFAIRRCEACVV